MSLSGSTSYDFRRTEQCGTGIHHPHRVYCPYPPGECCTTDPGPLLCCVDAQDWPCEVKRGHEAERADRRVVS